MNFVFVISAELIGGLFILFAFGYLFFMAISHSFHKKDKKKKNDTVDVDIIHQVLI